MSPFFNYILCRLQGINIIGIIIMTLFQSLIKEKYIFPLIQTLSINTQLRAFEKDQN